MLEVCGGWGGHADLQRSDFCAAARAGIGWRGSKFEIAGFVVGDFPQGNRRASAPAVRDSFLRFWFDLRAVDLFATEEPAGSPLDAGDFRSHLRNVQNLSH